MNISISADAVAWYGAIVATTSVFVGGYAVWRDRTRLRVSASPDWKLTESSGSLSKDATYIVLEVANVGRRPVHLRTLPFFRVKGKKRAGLVVKGPWQPTDRLQEGESASMFCDQSGVDLTQISYVVVRDATGRTWKGRIRIRK